MPSNIVKSLAQKTGKSEAEVEAKWEEAKKIVKKKTSENDDKYWPTVVSVVKNMLHVNEDVGTVAMTTTADIAVVPKRLGEPVKRADMEYDGELNGFPYFEIKEVGDYLKLASAKRMNKKLELNDERVHKHLKSRGGPFLVKHGNNILKLTKKDIYG